jgi:hypothetical protein
MPSQSKYCTKNRRHDQLCIPRSGGGSVLSGVGTVISSSVFGIAAAIIIGIAIGSYAGRISGGIIGGIYGVLAVGVGSLISSTALGVIVTMLVCACLAAWCKCTQCDIVVARRNLKESDAKKRERLLTRHRSAVKT